ncbi:uncharacterized protein LOC144607046 [Rhinoraja longicauda]
MMEAQANTEKTHMAMQVEAVEMMVCPESVDVSSEDLLLRIKLPQQPQLSLQRVVRFTQINEGERRQMDLTSRIMKGAEILAKRGEHFEEKYFNTTNHRVENIDLPEGEKVVFLTALILHEVARWNMKRKDYSQALMFLEHAENDFRQCSQELFNSVDNYGVLNLDITWCYLQLQDIQRLVEARDHLENAEKYFNRCFGKNQQRLNELEQQKAAEQRRRETLHWAIGEDHSDDTCSEMNGVSDQINQGAQINVNSSPVAGLQLQPPNCETSSLSCLCTNSSFHVQWVISAHSSLEAALPFAVSRGTTPMAPHPWHLTRGTSPVAPHPWHHTRGTSPVAPHPWHHTRGTTPVAPHPWHLTRGTTPVAPHPWHHTRGTSPVAPHPWHHTRGTSPVAPHPWHLTRGTSPVAPHPWHLTRGTTPVAPHPWHHTRGTTPVAPHPWHLTRGTTPVAPHPWHLTRGTTPVAPHSWHHTRGTTPVANGDAIISVGAPTIGSAHSNREDGDVLREILTYLPNDIDDYIEMSLQEEEVIVRQYKSKFH